MTKARKRYPSDVSDEEWAFCAPYLTLMKEDAPQREHTLRELYNGLRWFVRAGCPWRMLPNDLPPWHAVQQQTQRWLRAGCFETMAADLRALLRLAARRDSVPTAVILDSRTLQSTPESGGRGGYDGAKKRKGSKVHAAVDTLGHLLALKVTAANEQDRAQVNDLAQAVQAATGENVQLAYVDQLPSLALSRGPGVGFERHRQCFPLGAGDGGADGQQDARSGSQRGDCAVDGGELAPATLDREARRQGQRAERKRGELDAQMRTGQGAAQVRPTPETPFTLIIELDAPPAIGSVATGGCQVAGPTGLLRLRRRLRLRAEQRGRHRRSSPGRCRARSSPYP